MNCPSCGRENLEGSAFCAGCGKPLPETPFSELGVEEGPVVAGGEQATRAAPAVHAESAASPVPWTREKDGGPAREGGEKGAPGEEAVAGPTPYPASGATVAMSRREEGPGAGVPVGGGTTPGYVFGTPGEAPPGGQAARETSPVSEAAPTEAAQEAARSVLTTPPQAMPETAGNIPITPSQDAQEAPPSGDYPTGVSPLGEAKVEEDYYLPPEADYGVAAAAPQPPPPPQETSPPVTPPPAGTQSQVPPQSPGLEGTQVMAPLTSAAAPTPPRPKVICPECYAPNPEHNVYCQECGSALSSTMARRTAPPRAQAASGAPQRTAVLPANLLQEAPSQPYYATAEPVKEKPRTEKSLGITDILVVLAIAAVALALVPAFTWKKGLEISIFSHQGAFSQGRADLLGGPGVLPYSGMEFFTIGLVAAIGAGLALLFTALRTGRGPMYLLSGSLLLFPLAYLFFQAVLPLRQMGISVQPSLGLHDLFLGGAGNSGLGPPVWLITGAGLTLLLAGFLAPPRGWGRLFTFLLFFSLIIGAAFVCAACYNWNLFISDSALSWHGSGLGAAAMLPATALLPH